MLITIGLFLSVVILLIIGYLGEVVSGTVSKESGLGTEEFDFGPAAATNA